MSRRSTAGNAAPLLLLALLAGCGGGAAPAAASDARDPVTLGVSQYLKPADEPWIVDELHHVHGAEVVLGVEWLPNGDFEVELHPDRPHHYAVRVFFLQQEGASPRAEAEMWWVYPLDQRASGRATDVHGRVIVSTRDWSPGARIDCQISLHATNGGEPVAVHAAFSVVRPG